MKLQRTLDGTGWVLLDPYNTPTTWVAMHRRGWMALSYAGFTNDRCCPNGSCTGDLQLVQQFAIEGTKPHSVVNTKTIICRKCSSTAMNIPAGPNSAAEERLYFRMGFSEVVHV